MLKEIYEQPQAVARDDRRAASAAAGSSSRTSGSPTSRSQNIRRMVILACGTAYHAGVVGRYVDRGVGAHPRASSDIASEWRYRNPVARRGHARRRRSRSRARPRDTLAAVRLARESGAHTRRASRTCMGTQITREVDSRALHARRPGDGVAATKTFTAQVDAPLPARAQARAGARDAARGRDRALLAEAAVPPGRRSRRFLDGDHPIEEIAQRALPEAVLPLPRPPHRPARLPRGRAEAEGDLVHPDRGLLGGRDEARADRPARRGDARRRRRHRLPRLRQGRLEHPGGSGAGRRGHRDRHRRQRGHPAPRGRRRLRAAHAIRSCRRRSP